MVLSLGCDFAYSIYNWKMWPFQLPFTTGKWENLTGVMPKEQGGYDITTVLCFDKNFRITKVLCTGAFSKCKLYKLSFLSSVPFLGLPHETCY